METRTIFAASLFVCVVPACLHGQVVSASDVFKRTAPAVVLIETYDATGKSSGSGSGFLVSPDGKIITNEHVIAGASRATVRLSSGDAYDDVSVLDTDHRKDIALLKIKAVDVPA